MNDLYNSRLKTYAKWNGSAWCDEQTSGAYFYTIEKANNNGYYEIKQTPTTMNETTIVRFYENSYQFYVVEVSMEGSYTELFDGISNKFNKLRSYRNGMVGSLWAEVVYQSDEMKVDMFRVLEITPKMVEVIELTKGGGFEPIDSFSQAKRWKHVVTNPKELDVLATL